MAARARVLGAGCAALGWLMLHACESPRAQPAAATRPAPPAEAFVAPQPWRSSRPGTPALQPPELPSFRALVSQNAPLQRKTPRWQTLPPTRSVELTMPEGSAFRCAVTPLRVTTEADDFGVALHAWVLERSLLCSADDFRHWTEQPYQLRIHADGTREPAQDEGALLRERAEGGGVRHTYVLLRSDAEPRAATTGPPRILEGVVAGTD